MTNQLQSELLKATSSTFEKLGFVFPEGELEEWQSEVPLIYGVRVAFHGPVRGALQVRVSDDLATELAANMLGLLDTADVSMKQDALGEIANVICGNVVPALGKPGDVFDLDSPVPSDGDEPDEAVDKAAVRLELGVDEGRAELALFIESSSRRESDG